jgi:hypothetical protein
VDFGQGFSSQAAIARCLGCLFELDFAEIEADVKREGKGLPLSLTWQADMMDADTTFLDQTKETTPKSWA